MAPIAAAQIVAVGSEMLTPFRVDTNSLLITERLNAIGIEVRVKSVVGDRRDDLAGVLQAALASVDLVVVTGGLGPTDDDLTREVVAEVLDQPLVEDVTITERIRARFARRGLEMPEINRRQAMVPPGATVLPNALGTAPGLWLEHGPRIVVLLPGPPRELSPMLDGPIRDLLAPRAIGGALHRRLIRTIGWSESHVEEALRPLYARWIADRRPLDATILAARGAIDLHLTTRARSAEEASATLVAAAREVSSTLGDIVYSDDGGSLEEVVGRLLRARGWRIAVAESCTGGLLLKRLTDLPGSSDYVDCGVVVYSNEAKTRLAGVPEALIGKYGAVSEPVARALAAGIRARTASAVGVGVTGIAGPGGGSAEKPVGTVAIAVEGPSGAGVRTRRFAGDRELIRDVATNSALDMVRRLVAGMPLQ